MSNVRFLNLRAAVEALALMGIHTNRDLLARGLCLREVRHGNP